MKVSAALPSGEDQEVLIPLSELAPEQLQPIDDLLPAMSKPTDIRKLAEDELVGNPTRFQWKIENLSGLYKKVHSDTFQAGDSDWCLLLFPKGNNVEYLSIYLEIAGGGSLPNEWNIFVQFSLGIVNQTDNELSLTKDAQLKFSAHESNGGFTCYMPLIELYDPARGYLVNDSLIMEAEVNVLSIVSCMVHDSRKDTSYLGLKNQGATCYMNYLLQTLFHIPCYRKAIYRLPTFAYGPSASFPLALQILFYKLQFGNTNADTSELIESFGWESCDSFLQQDVQEFSSFFVKKLTTTWSILLSEA